MPKRIASRQADFVIKRPWVVPDSNRRRSEAMPPHPSASVAGQLILATAAVPTGAVTVKLARVSLDPRVPTLKLRRLRLPVFFPELGSFVVTLCRFSVRFARPLVLLRSLHVRRPSLLLESRKTPNPRARPATTHLGWESSSRW